MKALVYVFIVLAIYSCSEEAEKKPDITAILGKAPFKGITDSIKRDPENVELLLRRAVLLSQNNQHEAATPDYRKAWQVTGDEGVAQEYASNLLLTEEVAAAIQLLEEGNRKFPENTEFSRRLAEIYRQNGDNRRALKEYEKILMRDSTNFEAWFDHGMLLSALHDTTRALRSLERSFDLLPINYTGMALANIYVARRDPRALEICDLLLERDSSGVHTEPVYMKGVYYSETGQTNKAIAQFDECIKRDWKMTDAYIEKGILYFEGKKFESALKTFNMAATVSNTDADAYFWMARCLEATGKHAEAKANYERALALDQGFSEAREALLRLNG